NFGGPAVSGVGPNILNFTGPLTSNNSVSVNGGTLSLAANANDTATPNLFTGGINLSGGTVRAANDPNLGSANGIITLNGGTLSLSMPDVASVASQFGFLGNGINNS